MRTFAIAYQNNIEGQRLNLGPPNPIPAYIAILHCFLPLILDAFSHFIDQHQRILVIPFFSLAPSK